MDDPLDAVTEPVFPVRRAVAAGLTTSRARRVDLVAESRGLRRRRGAPVRPEQLAVAHAQRDRSLVVSHRSAALVWGLWLPSGSMPPPELSRLRPRATPRITGVVGHRLRAPGGGGDRPADLDPDAPGDLVELGDGEAAYTITSPLRTWIDLAGGGMTVEDLTVAGDGLLRRADGPRGGAPQGWAHPFARPDQVQAAVDARAGMPHHRSLAAALGGMRPRSDSPMESRLRLRIAAEGFPEPRVNPEIPLVWDAEGRVLRSTPVDLFFEAARLALQYEGEHHFTDALQRRRDMQRDEELRDVGVETLRVDKEVFQAGAWQRFVTRLDRMLRERGGRWAA